jgi:hypothetical protein
MCFVLRRFSLAGSLLDEPIEFFRRGLFRTEELRTCSDRITTSEDVKTIFRRALAESNGSAVGVFIPGHLYLPGIAILGRVG